MKVTHGLPTLPNPAHPVLTIGNFDGQHIGHRALVTTVVEMARQHHGTPTVLTFDPHPAEVLSPGLALRFLTTRDEKCQFFRNLGVAELVFLEFTQTLAGLTPEQFVWTVLHDGLGVRDILVGESFVFGKGRSGSIQDLIRLGKHANFQVHPVSPIRVDDEVVSSTRIRKLIQGGHVKKAAQCLGRSYSLGGSVVQGDQRGTKLGWPTANLRIPSDRVIPADGVYVTTTVVREQTFESVSYIGSRPTFHHEERLLEVHLFDVDLSLYGEEIHVSFLEQLRGDEKFSGVEQLLKQMEQDVGRAKKIFQLSRNTSSKEEKTILLNSSACHT